MSSRYPEVYAAWQASPEKFWAEQAEGIDWFRTWDRVLDSSRSPFDRWFPGGQVNTCYNALDRHVDGGRGAQLALIHDSPVTNSISRLTYRALRDLVARFAGGLSAQGVTKGDRVIVYMPAVPEAVITMLACARIGAVHSVVFGGFAAKELATRIDDCTPKLIVSASCGIEPNRIVAYKPLLDEAIQLARHKPDKVIVFQRDQQRAHLEKGRDLDWVDVMAAAQPVDCVPLGSNDPLYILYTSGSTGRPKGVVRDNAGHMVALKWSMSGVYGVDPGECFWAASDVGWVVGHSYIVYAPLLHGCTSVLFEGKPVGTPDASVYWRVISEHKVAALFTAPTSFRAIRREDPTGSLIGRYDLSGFRTLFLAGERADPDTVQWAEEKLRKPVIDHWWQTETAWAMAANCVGLGALPVKYGSPTKPTPGNDIVVLDPAGQPVAAGTDGAIAVKLPLPPASLLTLWNNDDGFLDAYMRDFPGFYKTGDAGHIDEDGYLYIMSRTDDVINIAGHRLSTGAIEEVLAAHPDVAECAVIGIKDALKGQVPIGLVVLNAGIDKPADQLSAELVKEVRHKIGPVAAFKTALVVSQLPKTRSGKILRGTMRRIADSEAWTMPATIEDPATLDIVTEAMRRAGLAL
ncbi:MAG: propionyl-CoA synthetase [Proteobacteria bacterium]|nr:propionyl-CoA synthetase [Pseudomonadota bacterium]MDA1058991.1 propionyl-CoA synthetase [Pseudomonadota bacterium]